MAPRVPAKRPQLMTVGLSTWSWLVLTLFLIGILVWLVVGVRLFG